jgi:ATP-dependent helicase/nuclease subunit B
MTESRLFTIPASVPFLPTVISSMIDGRLGLPAARDPLALAAATLFLPTRRACRLARDVFLDVLSADAALLPRIVAIGDIDEDEIAFADAATGDIAAEALDLPPALGGLERRVLLARLVLQWAASPDMRAQYGAPLVAASPAAALALADDLARLIDDMTTRQVSWDRLDDLVPDHVDEYWQLTLKFLKIARDAWPAILAERGTIEPAARRDRLIAAEAVRLANAKGPVIAAGSTGSMPATATLLATIARLPHGAVVLPGLDTDLDEDSWALIGGEKVEPVVGHPQYAMHALLQRLGATRDMVTVLGDATRGRERFVSEAMRPAAATERWHARLSDKGLASHLDSAVDTISVIETANAEEEALAIAVALRETLETLGKSAALVTPDRALARRVLAALARWNVPVDDSGGDALADTPAGVFARLAAEAALGGLAPVTLLALIKHPLLRLGRRAGGHERAIAALERAVLRGPRPRPGTAGLAQALATARDNDRAGLADWQFEAASEFVGLFKAVLAPLEGLGPQMRPFTDIATRHRSVIAELSDSAALADADGVALSRAFDDIAELPAGAFDVTPADYAELFHAIITAAVRQPETGARVRILGLLEARLQSVDRVVLGGLVEGIWPPEARSDPWLSRPMRHELGLDLPERRIGLSAHDFAQMLGAPEVILTRAAKIAGAPTVASRFLQRLAAVAGTKRWQQALDRGAHYVELARALDKPARVERIARPAPCPPLAVRPTRLSVTQIEHWLRDPYTIYARHILQLRPLDAVDTAPGARDRGTVIHAAVDGFTKLIADGWPADPLDALTELGRRLFVPLDAYPEARAFWWPRFQRIARWFVPWAQQRMSDVAATRAEIEGELKMPFGERTFLLTARADRIERLADGSYAIVDYKTGTAPSEPQVRTGLAPQLTLEAAILRQGGFPDIPAGSSVGELLYVQMRGAEPPGKLCAIEFKEGTPDSQADRALTRLKQIIERFEDQSTPYHSLAHPMWKARYGDYDHLARVKEWAEATDEEFGE